MNRLPPGPPPRSPMMGGPPGPMPPGGGNILGRGIVAIGLAIGLVVGVPLAILLGITGWPVAWALGAALAGTIAASPALISGAALVFVGLAAAAIALRLFAWATEGRARARVAGVVKMQHGQPVEVLDLREITRASLARSLELHYDVQAKEASRQFPNLHSYAQRIDNRNEAAAALPAPAAIDVGPLPLKQWLDWADEQPHILLGGKTKAGKTTTATAILARRLGQREPVFIIDPHSSDWLGLPTAGRVSHEGELTRALQAVAALYVSRMQEREAHKAATGRELPHDHFGRMTVLIDEANEIAEQIPTVWTAFTKALSSGGRKVGIALLALAQSPLVEDIKISGGMRGNFARIALDQLTVQALIDTTRDQDRRKALNEAFAAVGDEYPAAAQIGALVWLLDRDGMREIVEPLDARALVWAGWDYDRGAPAQTLPAEQPPAPGSQQLVSAGVLLPAEIGGVRLAHLIAKMIDRGKAPEEIGAVVTSLVLRVAPEASRAVVEAEIAQRARRLAASGNAALIAAQLDREQLIRVCVESGAGVNVAIAIYGGRRQEFYAVARLYENTGNTGNT